MAPEKPFPSLSPTFTALWGRLRGGLSFLASIWATFDARALRVLSAGLVALVLGPFLIPLVALELNEPLFGDSIVYVYTGWAIRHGMKLYRDVGMPDGPFPHFLNAAVQPFFGTSNRGLRMADLLMQSCGSAAMGAMLAPRARLSIVPRVATALAWGAMAATLWMSWYMTIEWPQTTERECFYVLFGSVGLVALYVSASLAPREAAIMAFAGGFFVMSQVFGKPTGLLYPIFGALTVLVRDRDGKTTRRVRMRMSAAGAGACVAFFAILVLIWGSIPGYFRWCIWVVYAGNRFLFTADWLKLALAQGDFKPIWISTITALGVGIGAIAAELLPARAIALTFLPVTLLLAACYQRGWTYQAIPALGMVNTLYLVLLASLWDTAGRVTRTGRMFAAAALACAFYLGFTQIEASKYAWDGDRAHWGKSTNDYAGAEREVGRYIKEHTRPTDTVYTMEPGEVSATMLYSERRCPSPFLHEFFLDPVGLLPHSFVQPNAKELAGLIEMQDWVRAQSCGGVMRNPPRVMTFKSLEKVTKICPDVVSMLKRDYVDSATVAGYHVYMRKEGAP